MSWLRLSPAILLAVGAVAIILAGWAMKVENASLRAALAVSEASLAGCMARADNITEDKESDDAIDRIPDDGLRDAASEWLFDPAGNSGQ